MNIVDKNFEEELKFLRDLVNINSGSYNKEGINKVAQLIELELKDLGFVIKKHSFENAGDMVVADFDNKKPKIALLGHMDTVFSREMPAKKFEINKNIITGHGVLDMKGGIAQIIYSIRCIKEEGVSLENIRVILVGDEEVGHENSKAVEIMKIYSKDVRFAFCLESGRIDNSFVVSRKGVALLKVKVFGKSAHAGNDYEAGVNAILELSEKILKIQALAKEDLGLTVNVGYISGGGVTNIVPEYAEAEFDIRIKDIVSYENLKKEIFKICENPKVKGTICQYDLRLEYPQMEENEGIEKIFSIVEKVCRENNYPIPLKSSAGGGADSAFFSMFGVPTLCAFGAKGEYNHTNKEYILVDGLKERTRLLADCLTYILKKNLLYEEEQK